MDCLDSANRPASIVREAPNRESRAAEPARVPVWADGRMTWALGVLLQEHLSDDEGGRGQASLAWAWE
jgi:hypothetical protein